MARAHEYLKQVLATSGAAVNGPVESQTEHSWPQIHQALQELAADHSNESEAVLREILINPAEIRLKAARGLTHALSPADMMRSLAIQTLAKWDKQKHHDLIQQVAQTTESDLLAEIAKAHL